MKVEDLGEIRLPIGDEVISCTYFRDYVIIITKHGHVYRLDPRT